MTVVQQVTAQAAPAPVPPTPDLALALAQAPVPAPVPALVPAVAPEIVPATVPPIAPVIGPFPLGRYAAPDAAPNAAPGETPADPQTVPVRFFSALFSDTPVTELQQARQATGCSNDSFSFPPQGSSVRTNSESAATQPSAAEDHAEEFLSGATPIPLTFPVANLSAAPFDLRVLAADESKLTHSDSAITTTSASELLFNVGVENTAPSTAFQEVQQQQVGESKSTDSYEGSSNKKLADEEHVDLHASNDEVQRINTWLPALLKCYNFTKLLAFLLFRLLIAAILLCGALPYLLGYILVQVRCLSQGFSSSFVLSLFLARS